MGINSYSNIPIPQSPLTDDNGNIHHIWFLFLSNLAAGIAPNIHQIVINGFTFTVPSGVKNVTFDPAGVIATGTVIMPANATDGQEIVFLTSNTITSISFNANIGQTVVNAPTALVAGTNAAFIFIKSTSTWYKK